MPRKKSSRSSPASSAAAAAAAGVAPTFTSFAAATALALHAHGSSTAASTRKGGPRPPPPPPPPPPPSEWDEAALAHVKRLSKRDSNTKLRALADLSAHLSTLPQDAARADVGPAFLTAWAVALPSLLAEDVDAAVRVAAFPVVAAVVVAFNRATAALLDHTLADWVAARADPNPVVVRAARDSLHVAFPAPRAQRAAVRFAPRLCERAARDLAKLRDKAATPAEQFSARARAALAVLTWLVEFGGDVALIAHVLDDPADHLRFVLRGARRANDGRHARKPAGDPLPAHVARLILAVLAAGQPSDDGAGGPVQAGAVGSEARERRLGALALELARMDAPLAWDVVLTLLSEHPDALNELDALCNTLRTAVTATVPTSAHAALLPVLHVLPPTPAAANLAAEVLASMRAALLPPADAKRQTTVAYALTALPAFAESVQFALRSAPSWFDGAAEGEMQTFRDRLLDDVALPALLAFVSGRLPPLMRDGDRRAAGAGNMLSERKGGDCAVSFARLVRQLSNDERDRVLPSVAQTFISGLRERAETAVGNRFLMLLEAMEDPAAMHLLAAAVVRAAAAEDGAPRHAVAAVALIVDSRGASFVVDADGAPRKCAAEMLRHVADVARHAIGSCCTVLETSGSAKDSDSAAADNGGAQDEKLFQAARDVGTMVSWCTWAGSCLQDSSMQDGLLGAVTDLSEDVKYTVLCETIQAHRRRNTSEHFVPRRPLKGALWDGIVTSATDGLQEDATESKVRFLELATDAAAGSILSAEVVNDLSARIAAMALEGPRDARLDSVVASMLRSPLLHTSQATALQELSLASLLCATRLVKARATYLDTLGALPTAILAAHFERTMSELRECIAQLEAVGDDEEGNNVSADVAEVVAKMLALLGERDVGSSGMAGEKLLEWAPDWFVSSILAGVELRCIVGDGDQGPASAARFLSFVDHAQESYLPKLTEGVGDYFADLSEGLAARFARAVAHVALQGAYIRANEVAAAVAAAAERAENPPRLRNEMIRELAAVIPRGGSAKSDASTLPAFGRMVPVVATCVLGSEEFRSALQAVVPDVVTIVRRDVTAEEAHTALDVVCASLCCGDRGFEDVVRRTELSGGWLAEQTGIALRAVRRVLEMPRGLCSSAVRDVEARGAAVVCYAMRALGFDSLTGDDVRFWTRRVAASLRACVKNARKPGFQDDDARNHVAWLCTLAAQLAAVHEALADAGDRDGDGKGDCDDGMDELCHVGAWASSLVILGVEDCRRDMNVFSADGEHIAACCSLVLRAATRGAMLSPDAYFPLDRALVYALVPKLSARSRCVRDAALTLVSFAAAVDLPEVVAKRMPAEGFRDETAERRFATDVIPQQVRDGLVWRPSCSEDSVHEVGFFLCWRVFIELLGADSDDAAGREHAGAVRRVGVVLLQHQPELVCELFRRAVAVIVDGTPLERRVAAAAAEDALRLQPGRVLQGRQLVEEAERAEEAAAAGGHAQRKSSGRPNSEGAETQTRSTNDDGDNSSTSYNNNDIPNNGNNDKSGNARAGRKDAQVESLEEEVGRAGGITFARLLQRLPALSRQYIFDAVERGSWRGVEEFVRRRVAPLLIAAEVQRMREWGAFGHGGLDEGGSSASGQGELTTRGSVAGREVSATYTFSDVTLEIGVQLPETYPLRAVSVEARSRVGMSEARWRKTLLAMTTMLSTKDSSLAEVVVLWRRNLDKTFQGVEECPICYSVLHLTTAALPKMQCRTCRTLFHSDCLCKWFTKSNNSACPLCRSAF